MSHTVLKQLPWPVSINDFLRENYPMRGKAWCVAALGMSDGAIRSRVARMGLKQDRSSPFFADWQRRAAKSKIGKKRPEQAAVMRALHESGRMAVTEEGKFARSKAAKAWHATNEHPRGALGMKHTPEARARMSAKSIQTWANRSQQETTRIKIMAQRTREANGTAYPERPQASWKAAWREIGGQRKYFRSRWEANYARYLEWLRLRGEILKWEHEPKTFWFDGIKRGCVSYLPDFRVTNICGSEEYHEVKGWMDDRSKTKIKRMAKYHPKEKLIVIATKQYKSIERVVAGMIEGWE